LRKKGKARPAPTGSVGSPACLKLEQWGRLLNDAFGVMPYLVGSATTTKAWRDVDVRMILEDDEWDRIVGRRDRAHRMVARWNVLCTAISVWGTQFTGLPIDFQFQRRAEVTQVDWDKIREPIGLGFYGVDVLGPGDQRDDV
jgi:hypothetical protein